MVDFIFIIIIISGIRESPLFKAHSRKRGRKVLDIAAYAVASTKPV